MLYGLEYLTKPVLIMLSECMNIEKGRSKIAKSSEGWERNRE
jgi:hypothetical protein